VVKSPKTGESYTNAEVARMSAGDLTVADVERIRTGEIAGFITPDPCDIDVNALSL
jgi:hypothetical protein